MKKFTPDLSLSKQQILDRIEDAKEHISVHNKEVQKYLNEIKRITDLLNSAKSKVRKCDIYRQELTKMLKNEKYV